MFGAKMCKSDDEDILALENVLVELTPFYFVVWLRKIKASGYRYNCFVFFTRCLVYLEIRIQMI